MNIVKTYLLEDKFGSALKAVLAGSGGGAIGATAGSVPSGIRNKKISSERDKLRDFEDEEHTKHHSRRTGLDSRKAISPDVDYKTAKKKYKNYATPGAIAGAVTGAGASLISDTLFSRKVKKECLNKRNTFDSFYSCVREKYLSNELHSFEGPPDRTALRKYFIKNKRNVPQIKKQQLNKG